MADRGGRRRIAMFVEGYTERGLKAFFHRWLDPHLGTRRVGIDVVNFKGVGNYFAELPKKVELHLRLRRVDFIVGIVDLYGLPNTKVDFSHCTSLEQKVKTARQHIRRIVPKEFQKAFHQHFAVHEVEAWLLAYPQKWPEDIRGELGKRPPEDVNFDKPPSKILKSLLGARYKKTVDARRIFADCDPQVAIDKCPNLKLLADDLLDIAKRLQ